MPSEPKVELRERNQNIIRESESNHVAKSVKYGFVDRLRILFGLQPKKKG